MIWINILSVAAGGFLGSILRYEVGNYMSRQTKGSFTYGTVLVNITGSFFLGCILSINSLIKISLPLYLFIATGFAGAFTTFSTAMYEQYSLIEKRDKKAAIIYFVYTIAGGISSAAGGYWFGKFICMLICR